MKSTRPKGTGAANHRLLVSRSPADFATVAGRWAEDGLRSGEVVACNLGPASERILRARLGDAADRIVFTERDRLYGRPPQVFAHYARYVRDHAAAGHTVRVLGELDLRASEPDARREWARYEAAVNGAFAQLPVQFLCHYALESLADGQAAHLYSTHPELCTESGVETSPAYVDPWTFAAGLDREPLPEPRHLAARAYLTSTTLSFARQLVAREAARLGADDAATEAAVIAVSEAAANAVRHGGGGSLRLWRSSGQLVCEVTNHGCEIDQPLAGYELPDGPDGPHGLWLIRQLAQRMEIRGRTIRLYLSSGRLTRVADPSCRL